MTNKPSSRIFAGLTVFLCAIVLLISVAGVIGTWVAGRAVSDAAVQLLNGVDKAAGAARTMIAQVNTEVGQVRDQVTTVKTATDQLSQNVSDKGLVLTLIPPETDSELLTSVRKVAESVANIRERRHQRDRSLPRHEQVAVRQPAPARSRELGEGRRPGDDASDGGAGSDHRHHRVSLGCVRDRFEGHGWHQPGGRRAEQRRDNAELGRYSTRRCTGTGGPAQPDHPDCAHRGDDPNYVARGYGWPILRSWSCAAHGASCGRRASVPTRRCRAPRCQADRRSLIFVGGILQTGSQAPCP